jgi:hypothetical protein
VIVDDLDLMSIAIAPYEADPPPVVDADAVLPRAITFQRFEPIAGRCPEVPHVLRPVELDQLASRGALDLARQRLATRRVNTASVSRSAKVLITRVMYDVSNHASNEHRGDELIRASLVPL